MGKRRSGGMPGGIGGGMPGGGAGMIRQLQQMRQKMEEDMAAAREQLEHETFEISKGGVVTVVINGHQRVQSVMIKAEALDTSDPEWMTDLSDLLTLAVNEAIEESQRRAAERMEAISGNLGGLGDIPGLGGLFG
jgi:DNA-binding YbaB/EbfC family protein